LILRLVVAGLITALLTPGPSAPSGARALQNRPDTSLLAYAVRVARSDDNAFYVLGEIAVRYAEVGQFNRALQLANSIDDEAERDVAKAKIATRLRISGDTQRASEILASIQLFTESNGAKFPRHKTYILGRIVEELAACGAFERVFELARINDDAYLIRTALDAVLNNFVPDENERGDLHVLSEVIRLSARINNGEDRTVLTKVAEKYAQAGEYGKALRLAASLTDHGEEVFNFHRDSAIENIALLLAKRGEFTRAIKLAESIDDYFKFTALTQIAKEQITQGRNDQAIKLLAKVTPPFLAEPYEELDFDDAGFGAERLAEAAVAYAAAGKREKAEELLAIALKRAKRVRKFTERDTALRSVAVSYAEAGMFEQAADAAQPVNFTYLSIMPLADVAVVLLRQKRNSEVQQVVKMIRDASIEDGPESKADSLVEIAGEYLTLGDTEPAAEILSAAFEIARDGSFNHLHPLTLGRLAVTLAQAGKFSKAIEVIAEIKGSFYRASALADIGVLQARAGWTPDAQARSILNRMI